MLILIYCSLFCLGSIIDAVQLVLIEMHCVGVCLLVCLCLTEAERESQTFNIRLTIHDIIHQGNMEFNHSD